MTLTPAQQAWHDYCEADRKAAMLLKADRSGFGTVDYEAATRRTTELYRRYQLVYLQPG